MNLKNDTEPKKEEGVSYVTRDGDRLDKICASHYGAASGFLERVLLANFGLAELGPVYQAGVVIFLPQKPAPATPKTERLWD